MSMITNQHFADVDDSDIKSERQRQLKGQYLQGFKDGVESQREFCTDVLDKIKGYIDRIRNTGMGKKKSLEFIEKFIEGLKSESGVK